MKKIEETVSIAFDLPNGLHGSAMLVAPGLAPSDPLREHHDDRSIDVPHGSGAIWFDVRTATGASAANAVFAADEHFARCDQIEVAESFRRIGVATALYQCAADLFAAPVVPSDILSPDARRFWAGRSSIDPNPDPQQDPA